MQKHERVLALREGGWVDRMHTVPKLRRYDTAGHQWNVTMLMMQLFPDDVSPALIWVCMTHDVPERWVGDTPYPAKKWLNPDLGEALTDSERKVADMLDINAELSLREGAILRICDMLEFFLWAREEVMMGNNLFAGKYRESLHTLMAMELYDDISTVVQGAIGEGEISEDQEWCKEMMNVSQ